MRDPLVHSPPPAVRPAKLELLESSPQQRRTWNRHLPVPRPYCGALVASTGGRGTGVGVHCGIGVRLGVRVARLRGVGVGRFGRTGFLVGLGCGASSDVMAAAGADCTGPMGAGAEGGGAGGAGGGSGACGVSVGAGARSGTRTCCRYWRSLRCGWQRSQHPFLHTSQSSGRIRNRRHFRLQMPHQRQHTLDVYGTRIHTRGKSWRGSPVSRRSSACWNSSM